MAEGMELLAIYNLRMAPGLLAFALCLVLLPRAAVGLRIALYIATFILIRDTMTPVGLWSFDDLRISFISTPAVLVTIGTMSALSVVLLVVVERHMRPLLVWRKGSLVEGGAVGLGAGAVIGLGAASVSGLSPMLWDFPRGFILGLVVLAYGGNLLEEVLFRGYLQGRLEQVVTPVRAALLSGLFFAACHSYLAITVTDGGWPILAFTAIEGIACGFVRLRHGIWAATLTHGTAILLISVPMLS